MTVNRANGNGWLELNGVARLAFVYSYAEGLFQGHCFSTWELLAGDHESETPSELMLPMIEQCRRNAAESVE